MKTAKLMTKILMNKRIIAALILLGMLCQSIFPRFIYAQENENSTEVIYIESEEDFVNMTVECKTQSYSVNKCFVLQSDLDLSAYENINVPYMDGVFEGKGHTITGVKMSENISDCGLFRFIGVNGAVLNLCVNAEIMSDDEQQHIGIIAGSNQGIISGCRTNGRVNAQNQVGGICGYNQENGYINDCKNEADIDGKYQTGGIVGFNEGKVSTCVNKGIVNTHVKIRRNKLQGDDSAVNISIPNAVTGFAADERANESGGIAGDSKGRIAYCDNYGAVGYKDLGSSSGGIAGRNAGKIIGCNNYGVISGRQNIGGVVGFLDPYKAKELDRDYWQEFKGEIDNISESVKVISDAGEKLGDDLSQNMDILSNQMDRFKDTVRQYSDGYNQDLTQARGELRNQTDDIEAIVDDMDYNLNIKKLKKYRKQLEKDIENIEMLLEKLKEIAEAGDDELKQQLKEIIEKYSFILEELKTVFERLKKVISDLEQGNAVNADLKYEATGGERSVASIADSVSDNEAGAAVKRIVEELNEELKDARTQLHNISNVLGKWPKEAKEFKNDIKSIAEDIGDVYDIADEYAGKIEGRTDALKADIRPQGDEISNQIKALRESLEDNWDQVTAGIDSLRDNIKSVRTTLEDEKEELKSVVEDKSIYVDVSETVRCEEQLGGVVSCSNNSEIFGNSCTGGIVGSIDINDTRDRAVDIFQEYRNMNDDDEEESEEKDNVISHVSAIIYDCKNTGDVSADESYVGGIVGAARYGVVKNCENYCDVRSENGKFAGGVAGLSSLSIYECYEYGGVYSKAYVGGIAGKGNNIGNCRSCAYMDVDSTSVKALGLVAGRTEGLVYGNLFVDTGYGAVDSVTLVEQAMGMSYNQLMDYEDMPEEFKVFTVRFIDDEEIITEKKYVYGEKFPEEDYPDLKVDAGEYAYWEREDLAEICRNVTIHSIRRIFVPAIASDNGTGIAQLIFGGNFYPASELKVTTATDTEKKEVEKAKQTVLPDIHYVITGIYPYELSEDVNITEEIEIRARMGNIPANTFLVLDDSFKCMQADVEGNKVGSYLATKTTIPAKGYIVLMEHVSRITVAMILLVILAAAAFVVIVRIFIKRKKFRVKKQDR